MRRLLYTAALSKASAGKLVRRLLDAAALSSKRNRGLVGIRKRFGAAVLSEPLCRGAF